MQVTSTQLNVKSIKEGLEKIFLSEKWASKFTLIFFSSFIFSSLSWASDKNPNLKSDQLPAPQVSPSEILDSDYLQGKKFEDRFLNLGVKKKFTILERDLIKVQVKNFIPPLLVPAIGGHAFVLPPGLFQVATSFKFDL